MRRSMRFLAERGFDWTETVREARKRSRATDADVISALLRCEDETDFRGRLSLPPALIPASAESAKPHAPDSSRGREAPTPKGASRVTRHQRMMVPQGVRWETRQCHAQPATYRRDSQRHPDDQEADWTVTGCPRRPRAARRTISRLPRGRIGVSPKMALVRRRIGSGNADP